MPQDPAPILLNDAASYTAIARLTSRNFIYVICVLFLMAGLSIIYLSHSLNERQIQHSEADAAIGVSSRQNKVSTALADYAFWGDAYNNTQGFVDKAWAFERDNIGPSLFSTYGLEGVFILGPTEATRYGIIDGKLSNIAANEWVSGDLPALLALARSESVEDGIAYAYFSVKGKPAFVSAAVIRPDSSYIQFDQLSYLLYVDILTDAELKMIEVAFELPNLKASLGTPFDSQRPQLRLQEEIGNAVTLQWKGQALGQKILINFLPILILFGLLVAMLVKSLRSRVIHSSMMLDKAQLDLRISEQRFKNIAEASSDWIWETDTNQILTYLSGRFTQLTGLLHHEWIGRPLQELLTYDTSQLVDMAKRGNAIGRKPILCDLRDRNNRLHYCQLFAREVRASDQLVGYQGTVCDITQEIEDKAHIEHISHHDSLTGLANRRLLIHYLNDRLQEGGNSDCPLFLLALDLDRFKPINDTFGHAAGDLVLRQVADAITRCTRETDLVARLGGDEFIVVTTGCRTYEQVEHLCQRLIEQIKAPIQIDGNDVNVGTSIGIAAAPHHGLNAMDVLRFADIALYEAKASGRNLYRFYEPAMNQRILERRQLEMDMRLALHRHEFRLDFQPRYSMSLQTIIGAEALVRWQHPARGLLNPDDFIPLAEETGLIVELSDWVLREACLQALSWNDNLLISVNLSSVEFQRDDLVDRVKAVLEHTGIKPQRLELEITESVMLEDAASALTTMNKLKALGVRLSIDDFGTGYSSLSYLRSYPFDGIKIDRSFIMGLDQSRSSEALVNAIISMGHALALTVTAEGIETEDQLGKLNELTCDQAQGFYLSRPVSPKLFRQIVEEVELS